MYDPVTAEICEIMDGIYTIMSRSDYGGTDVLRANAHIRSKLAYASLHLGVGDVEFEIDVANGQLNALNHAAEELVHRYEQIVLQRELSSD